MPSIWMPTGKLAGVEANGGQAVEAGAQCRRPKSPNGRVNPPPTENFAP